MAAVLFAGSAFAGSCPRHMREFDTALAKEPSIPKADLGKAKGLREKGEAFHKAGKHRNSVEALREAKKLPGV